MNAGARCVVVCMLVSPLAAGTSACTREPEPTDPRTVVRRVDMDRIPVPNHGPAVMQPGGGAPFQYAGNPGALQAEWGGETRHFEFMPKGGNAAIHAGEASRIEITGLVRAEARESLAITITGVRLDEAQLPLTVVAGQPGPRLEIRYETGDDTWWKIDPNDPDVGASRVTLERYENTRLVGTFTARLRPRSPTQGDALQITRGSFAVDLRLSGVKPGPRAPDP